MIEALTRALTDDANVTPTRRAAAGRVLAQRNLGDPRPEVMTIEGMQFCYVPAGKFVMGSDDEPPQYTECRPQHENDLPDGYWIGRYLVTNAQFQPFVAAGGYGQERFWPEAQQHDRWQAGKIRRYYPYYDENQEIKWRDEWGEAPANFGEPYNLPNHPVVGVTWYEALAFTRWLSEQLQVKHGLPGWAVRLPTEAEWEKAARGGLKFPEKYVIKTLSTLTANLAIERWLDNPAPARRYPWGDAITPNHANYNQTAIQSTSAVGLFPGGVSPYGLEDLSGNVWEWTSSLWGSQAEAPDFAYPYRPEDGREALDAPPTVARILRGGSYIQDETYGRCAVRGRLSPHLRLRDCGLRLVCVPHPSG